MKQPKISMVASDIDGTLLRSDGTASARTVEMIRRAQAQGILFTVCTGRYPENADALLRSFSIACPICGNNGATIWDAATDTVRSDQHIDPQAALRVAQAAEEAGMSYLIYARKLVLASSEQALEATQGRFVRVLERDYGVRFQAGRDAVRKGIGRSVNKFYIFNHPMPAGKKESLRQALETIPNITVTTSGSFNVEVIPEGCSKAGGVIRMAALLGVPLERVMAVGDYDNDLPMLTAAGLGVAMGNATPAVKARVQCVTASNDEDGLAEAIEKYALD